MGPKYPLPCWQVSASGVCTQRIEYSIHFHALQLMNLFWAYIPFWKIEGKTEVMERRGNRCKQLLDDLKEMTGCWKLKEGTLARTMWKRVLVCCQITEWKNKKEKQRRKETMNFLLRQGLVIFLETQGLRAFYMPLPTLKSTCGEAQNTAVLGWDISWSRGRYTARSPTVLAVYPLTSP
jgi:hypothetical protein